MVLSLLPCRPLARLQPLTQTPHTVNMINMSTDYVDPVPLVLQAFDTAASSSPVTAVADLMRILWHGLHRWDLDDSMIKKLKGVTEVSCQGHCSQAAFLSSVLIYFLNTLIRKN
jgi:hypothetical protein